MVQSREVRNYHRRCRLIKKGIWSALAKGDCESSNTLEWPNMLMITFAKQQQYENARAIVENLPYLNITEFNASLTIKIQL